MWLHKIIVVRIHHSNDGELSLRTSKKKTSIINERWTTVSACLTYCDIWRGWETENSTLGLRSVQLNGLFYLCESIETRSVQPEQNPVVVEQSHRTDKNPYLGLSINGNSFSCVPPGDSTDVVVKNVTVRANKTGGMCHSSHTKRMTNDPVSPKHGSVHIRDWVRRGPGDNSTPVPTTILTSLSSQLTSLPSRRTLE